MAQEKSRPTIEEFTSDPKYAEEKSFLWGAFDAWAKERSEEAAKKKTEGGGFLEGLFGPFAK
jgi:hypothetical protein